MGSLPARFYPAVQCGRNYSLFFSVLLFCYNISGCQASLYFDVSVFVCVFCCRLLNVLCCNLDSFLLLESQYNICSMLLQSQMGNVTDPDSSEGYELIKICLKIYGKVFKRSVHEYLDDDTIFVILLLYININNQESQSFSEAQFTPHLTEKQLHNHERSVHCYSKTN